MSRIRRGPDIDNLKEAAPPQSVIKVERMPKALEKSNHRLVFDHVLIPPPNFRVKNRVPNSSLRHWHPNTSSVASTSQIMSHIDTSISYTPASSEEPETTPSRKFTHSSLDSQLSQAIEELSQTHGFNVGMVRKVFSKTGSLAEADSILREMREAADDVASAQLEGWE
ncbi:hypothetical protein MIND_00672000 [Mycena indigotica]|uniref:Uncharacterized protein n=1 Tax=Mycena indigotica TaxID=2126181 RepID=A0A8H6SLL9_9AGAR|nr:uncharacterized protein MIND_00672000 [Mycena indigotica]KAF7301080.1 hypothetical protein MIND_00672000 [Mycena indigotica]